MQPTCNQSCKRPIWRYVCWCEADILDKRTFGKFITCNAWEKTLKTILSIYIQIRDYMSVTVVVTFEVIINTYRCPGTCFASEVDIGSLFPELTCCNASAVCIFGKGTEMSLAANDIWFFFCSFSCCPYRGFVAVIAFAPLMYHFMCVVEKGKIVCSNGLIPCGIVNGRAVKQPCHFTVFEGSCWFSDKTFAFTMLTAGHFTVYGVIIITVGEISANGETCKHSGRISICNFCRHITVRYIRVRT